MHYCSCMCLHWCRLGEVLGGSGYPTALRQALIQGMREAEREEVVWAKMRLEIPRLLLESSARAGFLPAQLSKFLSAASKCDVFSFQDHGLVHQTKDFPATVSLLKDGALSTRCCCPLLANTHKSKCAVRAPRGFVMPMRSQHPWCEIPIQFQVFSLPFFSNYFSIFELLKV